MQGLRAMFAARARQAALGEPEDEMASNDAILRTLGVARPAPAPTSLRALLTGRPDGATADAGASLSDAWGARGAPDEVAGPSAAVPPAAGGPLPAPAPMSLRALMTGRTGQAAFGGADPALEGLRAPETPSRPVDANQLDWGPPPERHGRAGALYPATTMDRPRPAVSAMLAGGVSSSRARIRPTPASAAAFPRPDAELRATGGQFELAGQGEPEAVLELMSNRRDGARRPRGWFGKLQDALTPELDPRGGIAAPGERPMRGGQAIVHGHDFPRGLPPRPQASPPSGSRRGSAPIPPRQGLPTSGGAQLLQGPTPNRFSLDRFLYSSEGTPPLAVTILGAAEGTRNLDGSPKEAYKGHRDPGNGRLNKGSFAYQGPEVAPTPEDADRIQLKKLAKKRPEYEAAARAAGLDPNDPLLATAHFDLFNQSEEAARRFRQQLGLLKERGVSQASLEELRFRSYVDVKTGRRFPKAAGGLANVARDRLKRQPTEAEINAVIRADQARRMTVVMDVLAAQNHIQRPAPSSGKGRSAQPRR